MLCWNLVCKLLMCVCVQVLICFNDRYSNQRSVLKWNPFWKVKMKEFSIWCKRDSLLFFLRIYTLLSKTVSCKNNKNIFFSYRIQKAFNSRFSLYCNLRFSLYCRECKSYILLLGSCWSLPWSSQEDAWTLPTTVSLQYDGYVWTNSTFL